MNLQDTILFNAQRWKEHSELQKIFEPLWAEIPKEGRPKTIEDLKWHLEQFLCNLYISHYYEKMLATAFKTQSFSPGKRYHSLGFKAIPFVKVFKFLESKGILVRCRGKMPYSPRCEINPVTMEMTYYPLYEKGRLSRIWPSDTLRREFDLLPDCLPEGAIETIVVREKLGTDKLDIPFVESSFTRGLRLELEKINGVFFRHYFRFNLNTPSSETSNPYYDNLNRDYDIHYNDYDYTYSGINPSREIIQKNLRFLPQIHAIFSNASFGQGGRLYSANQDGIGNWLSMPFAQRQTIQIDGRPTVELDYKAFHIALLYALQGRQLVGDPYDAVASREMRPVIKKLLLTVINADSEKAAAKSMKRQWRKLMAKEYVDEKELAFLNAVDRYEANNLKYWQEWIDALRAAHSHIAHCFCSGAGLMLQRLDSEIMRNILLTMAERDIPCLPVHDSAVVAANHESILMDVMSEEYSRKFDYRFQCIVEKK